MHEHGGNVKKYPGVLDFSANLNFRGMPQSVRRAAIEGVLASDTYPDPEYRCLRENIAYKEGLYSGQVLCGNGAAELIFAICYWLQPKTALLVIPGFYEYEQALRAVGCKIQYHNLLEAEAFQLTESILDRLAPEHDIVFITNPGNPTGHSITQDLLERIYNVCKKNQIMMVLDESFQDFLEPETHPSMSMHLSEEGPLLLLKSFTKMYAMAGLRVGYLLGQEKVLCEVRKQLQPWNLSTPAVEAALASLKELDYPNATREALKPLRMSLQCALEEIGCRVYGGEANYLFFKGPSCLWEELLQQGILIRDCSNYNGLAKGFYRVAVRKQEDNDRLIEAIKMILHKSK